MAAVTICSDLGATQNKVHHCFHCWAILSKFLNQYSVDGQNKPSLLFGLRPHLHGRPLDTHNEF